PGAATPPCAARRRSRRARWGLPTRLRHGRGPARRHQSVHRGGHAAMGRVTASSTIVIEAPIASVTAAIADYAQVRPRILPEPFSASRLIEVGQGPGTVAAWHLRANTKRHRGVRASVTVDDAA